MTEDRTEPVLEEVRRERGRQIECYGHNDDLDNGTGPNAPWLRPVDYLTPATSVQVKFRSDYEQYEEDRGKPTWMHLVREEVAEAFQEKDPERLESELIQVAALCVSWVETLRSQR